MLKKSRIFLSCMALAGAGFGAAAGFGAEEARAAEMKRPEDEALLADIFAPAGSAEVSGGRAAVSGQEDGSGTEMKGARAASRVQAVPLKVIRSKAAAAADSSAAVNKNNGAAAGNDGAAAKKNGGTAVEKSNEIAAGNSAATAGNGCAATEHSVATAGHYGAAAIEKGGAREAKAGGTEEIIYVYPNKSERETVRAPLDEWYDAAQHRYTGAAEREDGAGTGADRATGASGRAENEAEIAAYREQITSCLDSRADGLDLEKAMLYQGNVYDAAAYLSQTFAEVNACYENIGYDIINAYYDGNPEMLAAFAQKAQSFYVGGADTGFNPKFCGEDCSMQAVADAQTEQFAAFRTYLARLLAERPQEKLTGQGGNLTSRPQEKLTGQGKDLTSRMQEKLTGQGKDLTSRMQGE